MELPRISVVFPFYGAFDIRRAMVAIRAAQAQKEVSLDIVISEQGPVPRFPSGMQGVVHIFNQHIPSPTCSDYNPGKIRNIAIKHSKGDYIYTNDSDIVFINPRYLAELVGLLATEKTLAFYRPKMRRLPLPEFQFFEEIYQRDGIEAAIMALRFDPEYLATISGIDYPFKIVKRLGEGYMKTYTAPMDTFAEYRKGDTLLGKEPVVFLEDLHCGGNLFTRDQIEQVGGYCEEYVNWGCEDSDIQWKIAGRYDLQFVPKRKSLEVLHLDHPKNYFAKEMWQQNEIRFIERKIEGVTVAIERDKKHWEAHNETNSTRNS